MTEQVHSMETAPARRGDVEYRSSRRQPMLLRLEGARFVWLLFLAEGVAAMLAVLLVRELAPAAAQPSVFLAAGPLLLLTLALRGAYERLNRPLSAQLGAVVLSAGMAVVLVLALSAVVSPREGLALPVAGFFVASAAFLSLARFLLLELQRWTRIANGGRRTLIVGAGLVGRQIEQRLLQNPRVGLRPVGFVDSDPLPAGATSVLGEPADLADIIRRNSAEHVILAFLRAPDVVLLPLISQCEEADVEVSLVPRLFESTNRRIELDHLGALPLMTLRRTDPRGWQFRVKHTFDRIASALALLVLSPLLLAIALAVKLSSPGPVLFRQERIGRDGTRFDMLKFRSMRQLPAGVPTDNGSIDLVTAPGGIEGEDRRTPVGRLIRRTSVDELPQLINVLKGEMSLVGPRPERPEFVDEFGGNIHRYTDRHRVRSGLTGCAQVAGLRGKSPIRDRVEWDNHYIENWSLALDLKLLVVTAWAIFHRAE